MFPSLPTRWRPGPANSPSLCFGGNRPETKGRETQPARPCGVRTRRVRAAAARVARSFLSLSGGTFIASGSELTRIWKTAKSHQPVCVPRTRCVAAARVRTWKKD